MDSIGYMIMLLRKDFTAFCNTRLLELGLSQGLLFLILYIGKYPDCSPKELAKALHLDNGHVGRSLGKLEQGGFLQQSVNPFDRRAHVLRLTEKGEEAFRISHELFVCWDQTRMSDFSKEEQEQLLRLLAKMQKRKEDKNEV